MGKRSNASDAGPFYQGAGAFVVDHSYRDSTDPSTNEFYRWLGVKNSGGIRPAVRGRDNSLAALVLVSSHVSVATYNPWEDVVDPHQGRIWYWGDAKAHPTKSRDDWQGNRYLQQVWVAVNEQRWGDIPPILHFSKHAKGQVHFTGLCVLTNLRDAWMEDKGQRVRNHHAVLDILPVHKISSAWIRGRAAGVDVEVPPAWARYARTGARERLILYAKQMRKKAEQLPTRGSNARALLYELNRVDPFAFERLIVNAFNALEVSHEISETRRTRDGGFDFFGSFRLPPPLSYSIPLKGEVKRYDPDGRGVGPKDVARLVARLQRGEHGVFATNSYFTPQAQEEVAHDRYPVELIYGRRLLGLLTQVGAIRRGQLDPSWLRAQ